MWSDIFFKQIWGVGLYSGRLICEYIRYSVTIMFNKNYAIYYEINFKSNSIFFLKLQIWRIIDIGLSYFYVECFIKVHALNNVMQYLDWKFCRMTKNSPLFWKLLWLLMLQTWIVWHFSKDTIKTCNLFDLSPVVVGCGLWLRTSHNLYFIDWLFRIWSIRIKI